MFIGLVKWFEADKGYGVIVTPDEGEFFFHINDFISRPQNISRATVIIFTKQIDLKKNRNTAKNCHKVSEYEDWKIVLNYLGKPDYVTIEDSMSGRRKKSGSYHTNTFSSLTKISTSQLFKIKNEDEIRSLIQDYYDNDLSYKNFIPYCELLEEIIPTCQCVSDPDRLLNEMYVYFRKNLDKNILFYIWKSNKFKYINTTKAADYEISEEILKAFYSEIGLPELKRINNYSFGQEFCSQFIKEMLSNINKNITSSEIERLYDYIEFAHENEREIIKNNFDNLFAISIKNEIIEKAKTVEIVKNSIELDNYNKLHLLIPKQLNEKQINSIIIELNKILISKCSEAFRPELWINGIIQDIDFLDISNYFSDSDVSKKIIILSKLDSPKQFELLSKYAIERSFEQAFNLIEGICIKYYGVRKDFKLSTVLFDDKFWEDKTCKELVFLFNRHANNECSEEEKLRLFLKGLINAISPDVVLQNIHILKEVDYNYIFRRMSDNKIFIREVMESILKDDKYSLEWLYRLGQEFLDDDNFDQFDNKTFNLISQSDYFNIWSNGLAKILPLTHFKTILNEDFNNYEILYSLISKRLISNEEVYSILFNYLNKQTPVSDRIEFYKQFNHVRCLLQIGDDLTVEKIINLKNDIYNLFLWFLDKDVILDFEILKRKFIYFGSEEQIYIIRKLFFLKASGKLDLSTGLLDELTRFDIDLYNTCAEINPEINIDISSEIVIKTLLNFKESNRFFVEKELFSVMLNNLNTDKTRRFQLSHYFEKCEGRQIAEYDWSTNGNVDKIRFGNDQFYFAISFPTSENIVKKAKWLDFESLKNEVKKIPGSKWSPIRKHWGVPSQHENEVLKFARDYRFYLNFEGNKYSNNAHLVNFKRDEAPAGVTFCEGRCANVLHRTYNLEFWWCAGQACFSKCETFHSLEEWKQYTLLDFCEILGLNTDEKSKTGDIIYKGLYYQFVGLINKFNRLLEKLYCKDCNNILYPLETGYFLSEGFVKFHCINKDCTNREVVYLNHCLNGQCNNIIDSRVSKKCSNGMYICDICGSCCSHAMFERRFNVLNLTDAPNNSFKINVFENLTHIIEKKLGHLEKANYFCYKCGKDMVQKHPEYFICTDCDIYYDTSKYKFKRPHANVATKPINS